MAPAFHRFATFAELSDALADRLAVALANAIAARGKASLVVPGGTTPGAFFDLLWRREIAWKSVTVTLTDERWVPADSDRSNEHLVRARLLVGHASAARFVPLKTPDARARDAERGVSTRIAAIAPPFDIVLAGMGEDGHTASWIPGAEGLARALDADNDLFAGAIAPPPATGMGERITLTRRALLDSRLIVLLLRGESKRHTMERALAGDDIFAMPVRALLNQDKVPVEIFWSEG